MDVRDNNLYVNGYIVAYEDGTASLERERLTIPETSGDRYYIVKQTDRIDKIAYDAYRDLTSDSSKYWWMIADANDVIENPLDLSGLVGIEIRIPDFATTKLLLQ